MLLAEQDSYPAGAPTGPALDAYREATDLMSYQVLPQAYNLTLENGTTVRRTHDEAHATLRTGRIVVILCGVLAMACLAWLQIYLLRRFRRVLTPALALATVVAGVYAVAGVAVLSADAEALSTAKQDGFDSVLALARARAVSNSLHADQVRYLLDRERADTYEQIYLDKAQSLVYVEAGNLTDYYAGVAGLVETDRAAAPGLLGDQVSGSGAESASAAVLAAFQQLQETDRRLRAATAEPGGEAAVELRFGPLAAAFDDYDAALVALTNQHRAAFETAVSGGEDALSRFGFWQPVAMVAIGLLLIAGLTAMAATVALLATLVTAACGGAEAGSILGAPRLVIGVRPDLPLIGQQLPDGSFEGLDVDVARYVAGRLGAEVEFVAVRAADREPALLSGEADLVFAAFSITQDRKTRVGFAGPYALSYQDLLVREDETGIANVRDLAGRNLCAVEGSNVPDRVVEERGVPATLVRAADYDECMAMLRDGRVDALATNDVILAGLADQAGGGVRLVGARYSQERTGVGMRPGDVAGCEAINRAITDMYQDGTARRLLERWFGGSGIGLSIVAVPQFEGCS